MLTPAGRQIYVDFFRAEVRKKGFHLSPQKVVINGKDKQDVTLALEL